MEHPLREAEIADRSDHYSLAAFGLRPGGRDGAWPHHVGWALLYLAR